MRVTDTEVVFDLKEDADMIESIMQIVWMSSDIHPLDKEWLRRWARGEGGVAPLRGEAVRSTGSRWRRFVVNGRVANSEDSMFTEALGLSVDAEHGGVDEAAYSRWATDVRGFDESQLAVIREKVARHRELQEQKKAAKRAYARLRREASHG
jgi:hypothetical protein